MKKRFILTFPPDAVQEPVTYNLIKNFDIRVNILNAYISFEEGGRLAVEFEGAEAAMRAGLDYVRKLAIDCVPLEKNITFQQEQCINCGACTAVCFAGALQMDKISWKLTFDAERCIVCELCTGACPLKLFHIDFVEQ